MHKLLILRRVTYKDAWIRIVGSMWISYILDSLNRAESLFQQITSGAIFYIDLLTGFVFVFLVWAFTKRTITYLDSKYPWFYDTFRRMLLQALLSVFLPALLAFLFTFAYLKIAWQQDIFATTWMYNEFFVVILFIILINFFYFTYWLYINWRWLQAKIAVNRQSSNHSVAFSESSPATEAEKNTGKSVENIQVSRGEKVIPLPASDIAYAYRKDNYCYIKTIGNDTFVTTYAIDELVDILSKEDFFRVNRQVLVNRKACQSYKSIEFGKIEVQVEPAFREPVVVSQKRAKSFREWMVSP